MSPTHTVHMVVPQGIDDPGRPSGGNIYDRRLCAGLAKAGWSVATRVVAGDVPWDGRASGAALAEALGGAPDGAVVLLDGLVASTCPEVLAPASRRWRTVVLMHMPIGVRSGDAERRREAAAVRAAAAVVTTSDWARRWLVVPTGWTRGGPTSRVPASTRRRGRPGARRGGACWRSAP